ncbi:protein brick1 [Anaeramoeba flamelloides]|uniref:Protein brick1 n=1 Tax=Anaeramoeba flamelloides TaxID=1746091 RepID=A0AAV7ZIX7_9EUKA|nr:protein brick1 [Anaeramoeba flamelloides]KAJ3441914.1 protein brick1 [Anaeramoeba flamelloides]KAJ3447286.1 protein brick1 [Anaeramoeba flamelloides]KAJ3452695.1 protein brick1 [Anaeramoeba flamelloides]KAJ6232048.1 protein brick1 [Anaeramoeba flamelloides]
MSKKLKFDHTTDITIQDWEDREFIGSVSLSILKITEFLNNFDKSTRYRLAKISEKLANLERRMDTIDKILQTSEQN